jgi:cytochrome c biogenesis protein CcdA/glutaredoxin
MNNKIIFLLFVMVLASVANALTIEEINTNSNVTPIVFFKTNTCPVCTNVDAWIQTFENDYNNVKIIRININNEYELIEQFYNIYNVPLEKRNRIPITFIGDTYYYGGNEPKEKLISKIESIKEKEELLTSTTNQTDKNLNYIIGLALVDAINPCELAVLLILMTAILTRYPKQKNKALKAGLLFSAAIFIMYFIFGILLREIFALISGFLSGGELSFFFVLAIIAIIIGLLNIKDGIWYGGGGFTMEVPQAWRPKMKALIEGTTSPKGAFVVGLIVAFFLTPCTAGPYLVFSGIMANLSLINALPYLIIYMLIFISPMILITLITYFGFAKIDDMGGWRERNLKHLHIIAGILMLLVGAYMLLTSFGLM